MEVFKATQDLTQNSNFPNQQGGLSQGKQINKKKVIGLVVTGILVLSIFITTGLTGQVQKFFSRASMSPGSYGYGSFGSGRYLGVSTIASATPSASLSSSPSSGSSASAIPRKPGDTDGDNDIDIFDYNRIVSYFGRKDMTNPEVKKADLNGNNEIDIFDYNLVVSNFGR